MDPELNFEKHSTQMYIAIKLDDNSLCKQRLGGMGNTLAIDLPAFYPSFAVSGP